MPWGEKKHYTYVKTEKLYANFQEEGSMYTCLVMKDERGEPGSEREKMGSWGPKRSKELEIQRKLFREKEYQRQTKRMKKRETINFGAKNVSKVCSCLPRENRGKEHVTLYVGGNKSGKGKRNSGKR